jgi:hypothetical protein
MDDYVPLLNEFNPYRLVGVKIKLSKDEKEAKNGSGKDEGRNENVSEVTLVLFLVQ